MICEARGKEKTPASDPAFGKLSGLPEFKLVLTKFGLFSFAINFAIQSTFHMHKTAQQDIAHIRDMMERSSRFISLSGLSGVFAGIFALIAFAAATWILKSNHIDYFHGSTVFYPNEVVLQLFIICVVTLVAALVSAFFFTYQKSKKKQIAMWSPTTFRLLSNLFIPLAAGGIFCLALFLQSHVALIAPAMLVFYGLALINASKYTYSDINYLGYSELILGLIALFFIGYGLIFWVIGFGLLHIIYGIAMYRKYDRAA